MKDHLDSASREEIVKYRLEKSNASMAEAQLLADGRYYDSAVTRLYYACFYAVSALLIHNNIECGSHAGVKRMFSLHFGRTGKIGQTHIITLSNLIQGRQLSDYEDFVYQDLESYSIYKADAEALIKTVTELISKS